MKTTSVLLAIPDDWVLDECRNYLENGDHCEIEIARDGLECWTRMREIASDILIMDEDLLWGGADGVAARLLEDSRQNNVSVGAGDGRPDRAAWCPRQPAADRRSISVSPVSGTGSVNCSEAIELTENRLGHMCLPRGKRPA